MNRFIFLSSLIILVFLASLSLSEIPKMINYQGMLTDDLGDPMTDTLDLEFGIYTQEAGGTPEWSETQNGVQVEKGLFNVILGGVTPLNLVFDEQYWLEVQVDNDTMPRIRFTSVGYAYRALVADSALVAGSVGGGGGGWTDAGTVVRLETDTDSVGIGTATPATKLDVSGDININSVYRIGGNAVLSTPDTGNVFVGVGAGENSSTSCWNTFVGAYSGHDNTFTDENTFIGCYAGYFNYEGNRNTFVGYKAGEDSEMGSYNTYVGALTAAYNETGGSNAYFGYCAGYNNSGSHNTHVGCRAGQESAGDSNVFIGHQAGMGQDVSNKFIIANDSSASRILIYGDFSTGEVGIGTTEPTQTLDVNGTARLRDLTGSGNEAAYLDGDGVLRRGNPSSRRYKKNIVELETDPENVLGLETVRFEWKTSGDEDIGLIAEDVQDLIPDLVRYDEERRPDGVKYEKLSLYLLEAMKWLKAENEALKQRVEALEAK